MQSYFSIESSIPGLDSFDHTRVVSLEWTVFLEAHNLKILLLAYYWLLLENFQVKVSSCILYYWQNVEKGESEDMLNECSEEIVQLVVFIEEIERTSRKFCSNLLFIVDFELFTNYKVH